MAISKTPSQTSKVYIALRQDIMSGALAPGQKLKIEDLIRQYEAGNTPVREALSLLTSDALVERLDQRGFRVVPASKQEFEELLKTRIWLEQRALAESIRNGDEEWEQNIVSAQRSLAETDRSLLADHFVANSEWEVLHKRFHMALIQACASAPLLKFCNQLYDQNTRYRRLAGQSAYPTRKVNDEHEAIAAAVLSKNEAKSLTLLEDHYHNTARWVAERFS